MEKLIGVYVAGKISDPNCINYLKNLKAGIEASAEVMMTEGLAPFSPFLDFQYILTSPLGNKITIEDYQSMSMHWLSKSDAVYVHEGSDWRTSKGTLAEIAKAKELGIPVVYTYDDLIKFRDGKTLIK